MHTGIFRARLIIVLSSFLLFFALLLARLFYIQTIKHTFYYKIADEQHTVSIELPPNRGAIYDRNMRLLAENLNNDSVFVNARLIKDKRRTAKLLSSILNMDEKFVLTRISRDKAFVWIKRKITQAEAAAIKKAKLHGVELIKESKRFYPNNQMACHVMGAVDIDNKGLEGVELLFDRYLKGESGWLASSRDARSKTLEYYQSEYLPAKDGYSIVLAIDEVIQYIAEKELYKAYEKYNAKGASIIVMDPRNGDVLALANLPNFDLNNVANRPSVAIRNRAINDFFEPGSVFKIVTASAILEEKAVGLNDKFYCENGEYRVGKRTLHDHTPHGVMTFREIIEKSSNIGTVKAAAVLGPSKLASRIKYFGFFEKSGIDLPGEVVGMNRPLDKWTSTSMLAVPMGQEVTATTMQLARAISVIADNGFMVRPRIVKKIIDANGNTVKEFPARVVRKVISPETAFKMRGLLGGVVDRGTGQKAKVEGMPTGGKTGTAQKVEPSGGYSHDRFVASFIGFAPTQKPVISVVVCLDEPHPIYYGGEVAAPVFRNVVDETLRYLSLSKTPVAS